MVQQCANGSSLILLAHFSAQEQQYLTVELFSRQNAKFACTKCRYSLCTVCYGKCSEFKYFAVIKIDVLGRGGLESLNRTLCIIGSHSSPRLDSRLGGMGVGDSLAGNSSVEPSLRPNMSASVASLAC